MKNQITITLAQIKKHSSPCVPGWSKVFKANGGDDADLNKRFPVSSILDSNGLDDTLWVLSCLPEYNVLWSKFAWWCAVQVVDYANDDRVSRCLEVVKRHSDGLATGEELSAAKKAAAEAAADAAAWSNAAKWSEEWSAQAAAKAAATWSAAAAARADAKDAALAAAFAADAASAASVVWSEQEIKLREILDSGTWRD